MAAVEGPPGPGRLPYPHQEGPRPSPAPEPMPGAEGDLAAIREIASIATSLGATRLAADALELAERAGGGHFNVACLGQFKRGKSTLINALVGRAVLPTGILPVTSVPVVLRHGPSLSVRVRLAGAAAIDVAADRLAAFVAEEENPGNAKGVESVEVRLPSDLLASGLCLVDTPGLGSASRQNTAAARAFLPQVDAALVVAGADPPLTGDEIAVVEALSRQTTEIFLVLNKADRASPPEIEAAAAFGSRLLEGRLGRPVAATFVVSAIHADHDATGEWRRLESTLRALAERSGGSLSREALRRARTYLAERCLREISAACDAAMRPVADAETRMDEVRGAVAEVANDFLRSRRALMEESADARRRFADARRDFLATALPAAAELARRLGDGPALRAGRSRRQALRFADEIAGAWIERWIVSEAARSNAQLRECADRFEQLANAALERIDAPGGPPRVRLEAAARPETSPEPWSRPQRAARRGRSVRTRFEEIAAYAGMRRAVRAVGERALSEALSLRSEVALQAQIDAIDALRDQALDAVRRVLQDVYETADRTTSRAQRLHAEGKEAARRALDALWAVRRRVVELRERGSGPARAVGNH